MDYATGTYSSLINTLEQHLLSMGAFRKPAQKSKKGWMLDGERINLEPPNNPRWFAFNKLKKHEKKGVIQKRTIAEKFNILEDEIKDTGTARSAIWINCSVGEDKMISIVDWLGEQSL